MTAGSARGRLGMESQNESFAQQLLLSLLSMLSEDVCVRLRGRWDDELSSKHKQDLISARPRKIREAGFLFLGANIQGSRREGRVESREKRE